MISEEQLHSIGFERRFERNANIFVQTFAREEVEGFDNTLEFDRKSNVLMIGGNIVDEFYSFSIKIEDFVELKKTVFQLSSKTHASE